MTKKKAAAPSESSGTSKPLAHSLNSLLHTVRCIAQHEDRLCILLHEVQQGGVVRAGHRREMEEALDALPQEVYLREVAEVRGALKPGPRAPGKESGEPSYQIPIERLKCIIHLLHPPALPQRSSFSPHRAFRNRPARLTSRPFHAAQ